MRHSGAGVPKVYRMTQGLETGNNYLFDIYGGPGRSMEFIGHNCQLQIDSNAANALVLFRFLLDVLLLDSFLFGIQ